MDNIQQITINYEYTDYPQIRLSYYISYKNNDNSLGFNDKESNNEFNNLLNYKNKIEDLPDSKLWDKAKKLSNEYELIHIPNKKMKHDSISHYEPLSRSYFKMWELLKLFNFLKNKEVWNKKLEIACIAEGPGGFIEAFVNFRKKYFNRIDNIHGITLRSTNKNIPGWNKSKLFLKNNRNVKIHYGQDNTGNIYNLENILSFRDYIQRKVDIITADGGFDFSDDFNNQEQLSYRIIFCEIVIALTIQNINGAFICKFFDMYSDFTLKLLYLLKVCYRELHIVKPLTSRPANSEKYIIARGFKGIDQNYLSKLHEIVKLWCLIEDNNKDYIVNIFNTSFPVPNEFIEKIKSFNTINSNKQIENILKTLNLIENNTDNCNGNSNTSNYHTGNSNTSNYHTGNSNSIVSRDIVNVQTTKALEWCKRYDIGINKSSIFVKNKT